MLAILELPEVRMRVARWSVDDYEKLVEQGLAPKRGELIRGIIIEKMSKSPLQVELAKWIYDEFSKQVPGGFSVRQEGPIRLTDSEPEPDVAIVQGSCADFRHRHPTTALLVIEVAVSSVSTDREYASMYADAGIPEYWIVLAEAKQVEVRRYPVGGSYQQTQTYEVGETLICQSLAGISVSLAEMFA